MRGVAPLQGVLELGKQDRHDLLQIAPLGLRQMIEPGPHRPLNPLFR